jgi:hypothetical protein
MGKKFKSYFIVKRSFFFFLTSFIIHSTIVYPQTFRLIGVSDLNVVFDDGYKLQAKSDSINIFGIRGEVISGQFAIFTGKQLDNVTVVLSPFKNQVKGTSLPSTSCEWNFVGNIPLETNTQNQPLEVVSRQAPANFPDYLMAERELNIKSKCYQPVWITIKIPSDADPGLYFGKATVTANGDELSIPVSVRVFPLTMPVSRHLKVIEWHTTDDFEKYHGIKEQYSEEWFAMLRKYAENMVSHRQNMFQVPVDHIIIRKTESGNLTFNFDRFDQVANVFWDTKLMDCLETGFLANFGNEEWFSTEILLKDFNVIDAITGEKTLMKGDLIVPSLLPELENHLRQKGWLDKTLFHIRDEPSVHNALAWQEMSEYMHGYAPDLIRGDAIETTFLLDDIEIAIPKLDHFATWYENYKSWQEKGHELWFYTVGIYQGSRFPNKTIDMPVIDSRLMHWLNYKYDATGYLHWGWNQWDGNPYTEAGMHFGDAWHVYPVKDGVLNSLRWEEMRNGLQDYEYLWLLENKIKGLKDSLGSKFAWIDTKQRGKEIARKVIETFDQHTDDPMVLYKAKMEIIKELLDFNFSPKIYVQTNPVENSILTNHSSVEVFGWTEPGTMIVINGAEIPVDADGLFIEQFGGEFIDPSKIHLGNKIKVEAISSSGSKVVERNFVIKY